VKRLKRAILLIAHGSSVESASDDMFRVMDAIRRKAGYDMIVEAGFLELTAPGIPEAIDRCVSKGAGMIVIVPYFLHPGKHVLNDLPVMIHSARQRHPHVRIVLARHLGHDERLADIVMDRVAQALDMDPDFPPT
jgi:sirohydrochlorin ferrochelatase